jgi:hypothetical protein
MKTYAITFDLKRHEALTIMTQINIRIRELNELLDQPCFDENEDDEIRSDIMTLETFFEEMMRQTRNYP